MEQLRVDRTEACLFPDLPGRAMLLPHLSGERLLALVLSKRVLIHSPGPTCPNVIRNWGVGDLVKD